MAKVYVFLADGFEPLEALTPVDVLKRCDNDVRLVSISDQRMVSCNLNIAVEADMTFAEGGDFADADLIVLPGGMPGAENLRKHAGLHDLVLRQNAAGKLIGAICAAPMVLGACGLAEGRRMTCFPGFESTIKGAVVTHAVVEEDGNIITAEGPAAAMPFGFALTRRLCGEAVMREWEDTMRFSHLKETLAKGC